MTQRERMEAGLIYDPGDGELFNEQLERLELLYDFNETRPSQLEKRGILLKRMLGSVGENCYIEPPFHSNWSGKNVFIGDNFYANFNLTVVDDGEVRIGDRVMIGPNVTIATANHPILPQLRKRALQYNKGVNIGSDVWIGAGAVIVPGVTIGEGSVIGAGSVVTKDIPAGVVAVGNPCRVLREIGEHDRRYFWQHRTTIVVQMRSQIFRQIV